MKNGGEWKVRFKRKIINNYERRLIRVLETEEEEVQICALVNADSEYATLMTDRKAVIPFKGEIDIN